MVIVGIDVDEFEELSCGELVFVKVTDVVGSDVVEISESVWFKS